MKTVFYILATAIALVAGTSLVHQQRLADHLRQQELATSGAQLEDQVLNKVEDRIASFTEDIIPIGAGRRQQVTQLVAEREAAVSAVRSWGQITGWALAIAALVALAFTGPTRRRALTGSAFIAWALGILLPVMTLRAETDVTHLGALTLREETKSVLSMVSSLWTSQNWLLFVAVTGFGLLIPMVKTLCQFAGDDTPEFHRLGTWLARWALVDVIVIALVVIFLGGQEKAQTLATLQVGFWFFATSAVLSLMAKDRPAAEPRPQPAPPAFAARSQEPQRGWGW